MRRKAADSGTVGRVIWLASVSVFVLVQAMLAAFAGEAVQVVVERNVAVPMRDGVRLRADVFHPDRGGPYPVLVRRTPYGKGGRFDRFVKAVYIVVSQDARGR